MVFISVKSNAVLDSLYIFHHSLCRILSRKMSLFAFFTNFCCNYFHMQMLIINQTTLLSGDVRMKKILKKLLILITVFTVFTILFITAYVFTLDEWKNFQPHTLQDMELSLRLYDAQDELYLTLNDGENRISCNFRALPAHVKNAFIAIEDVRFYDHTGIDPIRIAGALLTDLRTFSLKEGASTITQQLIKLSELSGEKTLSRKTNEIIMAIKTEQYFSKDEILEMYLNKAYFGRGAYGIESAAMEYFGIHAEDMTIDQAALLAGIIKSPSTYAPHIDAQKCIERRDLVLLQMNLNGFISEEQYSNAKTEPIRISADPDDYPYGYYTDYVLESAAEALGISMSELLSGGYRIYTALDPSLQQYTESLMSEDKNFPEAAADGSRPECAIIIEDSHNGLISALIGGREHTARLGFSRATDMRRQPGSAIKPVLVFTPALEYGNYTTTSFLFDQPMRFDDYSPRNAGSTFRGWLTLRDTVAYSVNIPAVSLFEEIGIERCIDYAKTVGIPFTEKDDNLSLALGGFTDGITPLELAGAYLPYANRGVYSAASPIRRITDAKGSIVYDHGKTAGYQVISEETAYLMSSMLGSVVEYGTATNLYCDKIPLCAKTGTTSYDDADNNKDAWIVAYNPDYIICTWMGFDKTDSAHSLKKGETGGEYPAHLTKKIFEKIYENKTAPSFTIPDNIERVWLDEQELTENFRTVAVPASALNTITEFFTEDTAPRLYENDDYTEKYIYYDIPSMSD